MLKKIHPDHLRVALVAFNLLLTAFMVWCGFWAFGFNKALGENWWRRVNGFAVIKDPEKEYALPDQGPKRGTVGSQPSLIADSFEPAPPLPVVEETAPEEETEEVLEEGGPLDETWELQTAYLSSDRSKSCAFIAEKQPKSRSRYPRRTTYTPRSRTTKTSSSASRYARSALKRKSKLWFINDTAEIDEVAYVLLDIIDAKKKPLSIVYRAEEEEKKYVLRKEEKTRDPLVIEEEKEEEEGTTSTASKYKSKSKTAITDPGGIRHGSRMLGKEKETGASSTKSGSSGTTQVRRTITAKEKKELRDALKKIPATERSKVTKALSRGMKR